MKTQIRHEQRERLDILPGVQPQPSPTMPQVEYVGMCEECYLPMYRKVGGRVAACGNGHTKGCSND